MGHRKSIKNTHLTFCDHVLEIHSASTRVVSCNVVSWRTINMDLRTISFATVELSIGW